MVVRHQSNRLSQIDSIAMMADKGQSVQLKEYEGAKHYLHLDRIGIQLQVSRASQTSVFSRPTGRVVVRWLCLHTF